MPQMLGEATFRYRPLREESEPSRRLNLYSMLFACFIGAAGLIAILRVTYMAGKNSTFDALGRVIRPRTIAQSFDANSDFIGRPTPEKEHAWHGMFPDEGGFFVHPTLAPRKSVVSVFHQLHCLEGIWRQWWLLYDGWKDMNQTLAMHPRLQEAHTHPIRVPDPVHVNHCIELLRLQLMCLPDLTIEVAKTDTGGVEGFGTVHQCRNWNDVVAWTQTWESYMLVKD